MRAQAEQTGAAPQPIRRAEGPKPGLPARASQGGQRGVGGWGEARARDLRNYSAIKNLHTRTEPGLSSAETQATSPPNHPEMMQVRTDSPSPLPTCGKEGKGVGGGAEAETAPARPK